MTFDTALSQWLTLRSLNKRPKTVAFYRDVHRIISESWPDKNIPVVSITRDVILQFAPLVTHHCPSRWNTIVAALRHISPEARCLSRRRLRVRGFTPPSQLLFDSFLADVDANPRTQAGLIVRFFVLTGLRKGEGFGLRWENVFDDYIKIPAALCKSGVERNIPMLPGLREVLSRLRTDHIAEYVLPRESPRKAIETASKRVFGVQWSLHSFRHLFATRCIERGVDIPTVAIWLGHQDRGVTLTRTYLHLIDEHSRRMAAKVEMLTPTVRDPSQSIPSLPPATMSLNYQVTFAMA